jgi:acetoacetate decarboxylase
VPRRSRGLHRLGLQLPPFTSFGPYNEAIMLIRVEFEGEAYSYCPFIYIDGEAPLGVRSEAGVRSSPT